MVTMPMPRLGNHTIHDTWDRPPKQLSNGMAVRTSAAAAQAKALYQGAPHNISHGFPCRRQSLAALGFTFKPSRHVCQQGFAIVWA